MVSTIKSTQKQKKVGRPFADTQAVNVRLPTVLLAKIDEWRSMQRPIPTRPAAIRLFVESNAKLLK